MHDSPSVEEALPRLLAAKSPAPSQGPQSIPESAVATQYESVLRRHFRSRGVFQVRKLLFDCRQNIRGGFRVCRILLCSMGEEVDSFQQGLA